MGRLRHGVAGLVVIVASLSSCGSVALAADEDMARAKERFDEAASAFEQRRYADAGTAYEQAAALSPHSSPLINAAAAWELDGNYVRAARACDMARSMAKDEATRADVDRRLARLSRRIATLQVDGVSNLAIRVDRSVTVTPPGRLRLSAGGHVLELVDESTGVVRSENVSFSEGETRNLVLAKAQWAVAPKDAAPPSVGSPNSFRGPPLPAWVAFGVAAASGVGAAAFGALTLKAKDDFDARPTEEHADRFDRYLVTTNALLGVAGVSLLVAGAIWIFSPRPSTAHAGLPAIRFVF